MAICMSPKVRLLVSIDMGGFRLNDLPRQFWLGVTDQPFSSGKQKVTVGRTKGRRQKAKGAQTHQGSILDFGDMKSGQDYRRQRSDKKEL